MVLAALERRVRVLEAALWAIGKQCRCRAGQQTSYHTAEELKRITDIRCPAHGFRDLGHLARVGSGLPLQPGDQHLCSCPPCPVREFLLGRRGPLTEQEQEEEERRWAREFAPGSDEDFRRDEAQARQLLQKYQYDQWKRRKK